MQKQITCAGGVLFKNPKFSYSVHIMSRVQHMHKKLLSNWEIRVSQWLQTSLCSQPLMLCRLLYIILPTLQYACYMFPAQKWKWQSEFWTTFCNCIFYCHFYCWLLLCLLRTLVFANLNVHGRYNTHLFYKCEQQGWGSVEIGHSSWIW